MALKYRGDQTGTYDHRTRTGLVGKVIGPDAGGAYRVISAAAYDAENDVTLAETSVLVHPEHVFDAIESSVEEGA